MRKKVVVTRVQAGLFLSWQDRRLRLSPTGSSPSLSVSHVESYSHTQSSSIAVMVCGRNYSWNGVLPGIELWSYNGIFRLCEDGPDQQTIVRQRHRWRLQYYCCCRCCGCWCCLHAPAGSGTHRRPHDPPRTSCTYSNLHFTLNCPFYIYKVKYGVSLKYVYFSKGRGITRTLWCTRKRGKVKV